MIYELSRHMTSGVYSDERDLFAHMVLSAVKCRSIALKPVNGAERAAPANCIGISVLKFCKGRSKGWKRNVVQEAAKAQSRRQFDVAH